MSNERNKLYEKTLFTNPQELILGDIYEYDISKSNISALLNAGYISLSDYDFYASLPKEERQISIGKMMLNDNNIYNIIHDQIKNAKKNIIEKNDIYDTEIVSIKNDAIFTTRKLQILEFGNLEFREANHYNLFINLIKNFHLELYFGQNEDEYILDVKGINNDMLSLHDKYMSTLCNTFSMIINNNYVDALQYFSSFCKAYDSKSLDIEYYRTFDSNSKYDLIGPMKYSSYFLSNNYIPIVDISHNRVLNQKIMNIITMLYFNMK